MVFTPAAGPFSAAWFPDTAGMSRLVGKLSAGLVAALHPLITPDH